MAWILDTLAYRSSKSDCRTARQRFWYAVHGSVLIRLLLATLLMMARRSSINRWSTLCTGVKPTIFSFSTPWVAGWLPVWKRALAPITIQGKEAERLCCRYQGLHLNHNLDWTPNTETAWRQWKRSCWPPSGSPTHTGYMGAAGIRSRGTLHSYLHSEPHFLHISLNQKPAHGRDTLTHGHDTF